MTAAEQQAFTRKLAYVVMALLLARVAMDVDMLRREYALHQLLWQGADSASTPADLEAQVAESRTLSLAAVQAAMRYSLMSIPVPVLFLYFIFCIRRNLNLLQVADLEFTPG
jgi:hypothetical protein